MKVLVATSQGQGDQHDDFNFTVEGELVSMPFGPCPDDHCGCKPSAFGLASSKGTTTVAAVEKPDLDVDAYLALFRDAMDRMGWLAAFDPGGIEEWVAWHVQLADAMPEGAIARAKVRPDGEPVLLAYKTDAP